jgi:hypothetical protein
MRINQKDIDKGQLGKTILVLEGALFPFSILSLVFSFATLYKIELYKYINLPEISIIASVAFIGWLWIFYTYIYPSKHKGFNEQSWKHDNPIRLEFDKVHDEIFLLKDVIKNIGENNMTCEYKNCLVMDTNSYLCNGTGTVWENQEEYVCDILMKYKNIHGRKMASNKPIEV